MAQYFIRNDNHYDRGDRSTTVYTLLIGFERLFLAVPRGCLRFVIVVFPDHTPVLFLIGLFYFKVNIDI